MSRTTKQPKTGGKAVDSHCQNNGICPTCISNRTISSQRQESKAVLALREYLRNAPQEELDASMARVKAMNLQGPTFSELMAGNPTWQLHLAEQQLEVARKALKDISAWNKNLQADVEEHHSGTHMWHGCIAEAKKALQEMRNLKRK